MKQEIEDKINEEADLQFPIHKNVFNDKDEYTPKEIAILERIAYCAGARRGYELAMEERDEFTIKFAEWIIGLQVHKGKNGLRWYKGKPMSSKELLDYYKNPDKEL